MQCRGVISVQSSTTAPPSNAVFDYSGHFLLYPTLCGIKVVNIETNRLCRVLGAGESNERFLAISLYQGTPKVIIACVFVCGNSVCDAVWLWF